jgi:amidase
MLTRTVTDTAAALDVLAGYEPGDANWAPSPSAPFAEAAAREPSHLRIGLALAPPLDDATLDPTCERAARDAADLLASLGHGVEEATPPWTGPDVLPDFTRAFGPQISMATLLGSRVAGREPTEDDVEPLTWAIWRRTREQDALVLLDAQARLERLARGAVAFLAGYDALVTPAMAQRPVVTGAIHGRGPDPWDHYRRSGYFTPFTAICNVTGQPAISVPLYQGDDGLPTAVQLIGPPACEDVLLALAAQLEQASPWADRVPELGTRARDGVSPRS